MLGICCDASNPAGRPDARDPLLHPFTLVRLEAREQPEFYETCYELQADGYQLAIVLDSDSFPNGISEAQIRTYLGRVDPEFVVVGNEMDAFLILDEHGQPVESGSSWKMTAEDYSEFASLAFHTIRDCRPDTLVVGGGLISGQVAWFANYHGPDLDAWDLHSYLDLGPDSLRDYIRAYGTAAGCPIVMFEWARAPESIAETLAVIQAETIANCYFCWTDAMVPDLGLLNDQGLPKPEYDALVNAASAPTTEEPVSKIEVREKEKDFALGKRWGAGKIHDLTPDGSVRLCGYEKGIVVEIDGDCWDVPNAADVGSFLKN